MATASGIGVPSRVSDPVLRWTLLTAAAAPLARAASALFGGTGPHRNVEEHTVTGTPLLTGSGVPQE
jgi:hypothetical protein